MTVAQHQLIVGVEKQNALSDALQKRLTRSGFVEYDARPCDRTIRLSFGPSDRVSVFLFAVGSDDGSLDIQHGQRVGCRAQALAELGTILRPMAAEERVRIG